MLNSNIINISQHKLLKKNTINLSVSLDVEPWMEVQIKASCLLFKIALENCGDQAGWNCSIEKLAMLLNIQCEPGYLVKLIDEIADSNYIPQFQIMYHKHSRHILFLNKSHHQKVRYLTTFLTKVSQIK